jgi:hypothetical protein
VEDFNLSFPDLDDLFEFLDAVYLDFLITLDTRLARFLIGPDLRLEIFLERLDDFPDLCLRKDFLAIFI